MHPEVLALQKGINELKNEGVAIGELSDGYHSFNELYAMREALFLALAKKEQNKFMGKMVWYSRKQSDGTDMPGWIIAGIGTKAGEQITFHLPESRFADLKGWATYRDMAPQYDGHTSADVIKRLAEL